MNARVTQVSAAIAMILASSAAALAAEGSGQKNELDEVVVTAERRDTDAQKVPASVVAFSGESLQERGITNLDTLQYQVPSVSFQDLGNVRFFNIRGIGIAEGAPNQSVGVATHLDGTVIAREFNINDSFFDVSGVEVLRGPQGTYAGQNSSGGAVFITSVKPVIGKSGGFATATLGSYDQRKVGAGVDIPLSDSLAARVSGEFESRDSFTENVGPAANNLPNGNPNQPGNLSRYLGRAQLLYAPSERVEARLIWQFSDNRSDGLPLLPLNGRRFSPDNFADPWTIAYDFPAQRNTKYDRVTATAKIAISEAVSLRIAETWQKLSQVYDSDNDYGSPIPTGAAQSAGRILIDDHYTTGEVTLLSTTDGPFQWTTGFTYLDYQQDGTVLGSNYTTVPNFNVGGLNLYIDTIRRNQSVFGEVGYHLSSSWEVKAGLRYNRDQAGFTPDSYVAPVGGLSLSAGPKISLGSADLTRLTSTTGRVLVNWTPTTRDLVYAVASKGYKPGGRTPFNIEYGSEYVTNYELGWKTTTLDGMLRTSLAAFHMLYDNYQATVATDPTNPATAVTRNVDGTKINGVEGQVELALESWHFDMNFSYLDAKYGNLALFAPADLLGPVAPGTPPTAINLKGRRVSYAPEYSASIGASYRLAAFGGELTPSARVSYVDKQWVTFMQAPYNLLASRTLVDFRLDYQPVDADWSVQGFVTNLLGRKYASTLGSAAGNGFYGNAMLGAPRQFGVSVNYRF